MYEEYMQNFLNYPINGYRNTYDQMIDSYQYNYPNNDLYGYAPYNIQNRNNISSNEMESYYPEIYNVIYPMVKKVCLKNNRGISQEVIDDMVEEIYSNLENNKAITLNIVLNNEINGQNAGGKEDLRQENRQLSRNNVLSDLIRILVLRELIGRPGCHGSNCRPPMPPPPRPNRPPFPRYDFGEI